MPNVKVTLNPPLQYSLIWLLIGCGLALLVALWYGFIFWNTRAKKPKSLADLPLLAPGSDLASLQQKYLQLIDQCYQAYRLKRTNLRGLHRSLSITVRYFVYEASHFPAPLLTLGDLEKAPYPKLTKVVADYYDKEFSQIEHGDPQTAVRLAKELVTQWG